MRLTLVPRACNASICWSPIPLPLDLQPHPEVSEDHVEDAGADSDAVEADVALHKPLSLPARLVLSALKLTILGLVLDLDSFSSFSSSVVSFFLLCLVLPLSSSSFFSFSSSINLFLLLSGDDDDGDSSSVPTGDPCPADDR